MTKLNELIKNILNIDEEILKNYKSISFREESLEKIYLQYEFMKLKNQIWISSIGILVLHLINLYYSFSVFDFNVYYFWFPIFLLIADVILLSIVLSFYFSGSNHVIKCYKICTCARFSILLIEYMISAFLCFYSHNLKIKFIFGKIILMLIHIKNIGYLAMFRDNFYIALLLSLLIFSCLLGIKIISENLVNSQQLQFILDYGESTLNENSNANSQNNLAYLNNEIFYFVKNSITILDFLYEFFCFLVTYFFKRYISIYLRRTFLEKYKFQNFFNYCEELICGLNGFHVSFIKNNLAFISPNLKNFIEKNYINEIKEFYDTKNFQKILNIHEKFLPPEKELKIKYHPFLDKEDDKLKTFDIESDSSNTSNKNKTNSSKNHIRQISHALNDLKNLKSDKNVYNQSINNSLFNNTNNFIWNIENESNLQNQNKILKINNNYDVCDIETIGRYRKNDMDIRIMNMIKASEVLSNDASNNYYLREKIMLSIFMKNLKYCDDENIDLSEIIEILILKNFHTKTSNLETVNPFSETNNRQNIKHCFSNKNFDINLQNNEHVNNISQKNLNSNESNFLNEKVNKLIFLSHSRKKQINEKLINANYDVNTGVNFSSNISESKAHLIKDIMFPKENSLQLNGIIQNFDIMAKKSIGDINNIKKSLTINENSNKNFDNSKKADFEDKKYNMFNFLEKNNCESQSENLNYKENDNDNENNNIHITKKVQSNINTINNTAGDFLIKKDIARAWKKDIENNCLINKKNFNKNNKRLLSLERIFQETADHQNCKREKNKRNKVKNFRIIGKFQLNLKDCIKFYLVYYRKINNVLDIFFKDCTTIKNAVNIESENKIKQKILSKIGHEFKTPLNSILGLINSLKITLKKTKEIRELDLIQSLSNYTIYLISDVIQYASNETNSLQTHKNCMTDSKKLEKNKKVLRKNLNIFFRSFDVIKNLYFCFDILNALLSCHESKKELITTELFIEDKFLNFKIINDEIRVNQIILNFITNAVKFTKKGKIVILASFVQCKKKNKKEENDFYSGKNITEKDTDNDAWSSKRKSLNEKSLSVGNENQLNSFMNKFKNSNQENMQSENTIKQNAQKMQKNNSRKKIKGRKASFINNGVEKDFYLKISIIDTGIGISEEKQVHLFNEDMKLNTAYDFNHQGTGLGLSICMNLIKLLNLKIIFSSKENCGSVFSLLIPALKLSNVIIQKESTLNGIRNSVCIKLQGLRQNSTAKNKHLCSKDDPINNKNNKTIQKFLSYKNNNKINENNIKYHIPNNSKNSEFKISCQNVNVLTKQSSKNVLEKIYRSIIDGMNFIEFENLRLGKKYSMKLNKIKFHPNKFGMYNRNITNNNYNSQISLNIGLAEAYKGNLMKSNIISESTFFHESKINNKSNIDNNYLNSKKHYENPIKSNFFKSLRFKSSRIINNFIHDNIQIQEFPKNKKVHEQRNSINKIKKIEITSNVFSRGYNRNTLDLNDKYHRRLILTKNFKEKIFKNKIKTSGEKNVKLSSFLFKKYSHSEETKGDSQITIKEISNNNFPTFEHFYMKCDENRNLKLVGNKGLKENKNSSNDNVSVEYSIRRVSSDDLFNGSNNIHYKINKNIPSSNRNSKKSHGVTKVGMEILDKITNSFRKKRNYFQQSEENKSSIYKKISNRHSCSIKNLKIPNIHVKKIFTSDIGNKITNTTFINCSDSLAHNHYKNEYLSNLYCQEQEKKILTNNISISGYEYEQIIMDNNKYIINNQDYEILNFFSMLVNTEKWGEIYNLINNFENFNILNGMNISNNADVSNMTNQSNANNKTLLCINKTKENKRNKNNENFANKNTNLKFPVFSKTLNEISLKRKNPSLFQNNAEKDIHSPIDINRNKKMFQNKLTINNINNIYTYKRRDYLKNLVSEKSSNSNLNISQYCNDFKADDSHTKFKINLCQTNNINNINSNSICYSNENIKSNSLINNYKAEILRIFNKKFFLNYKYDDNYIFKKSHSFLKTNSYSYNATNTLTNTLLYFNPFRKNPQKAIFSKNTIFNNTNNNSLNNNLFYDPLDINKNTTNNNILINNSLVSSNNNKVRLRKKNFDFLQSPKTLDSNSEYQNGKKMGSQIEDKNYIKNFEYKNTDFFLENEIFKKSKSKRNKYVIAPTNGVINNSICNCKSNLQNQTSENNMIVSTADNNCFKHGEGDSCQTQIVDEINFDYSKENIHDLVQHICSPYSELADKGHIVNNVVFPSVEDDNFKIFEKINYEQLLSSSNVQSQANYVWQDNNNYDITKKKKILFDKSKENIDIIYNKNNKKTHNFNSALTNSNQDVKLIINDSKNKKKKSGTTFSFNRDLVANNDGNFKQFNINIYDTQNKVLNATQKELLNENSRKSRNARKKISKSVLLQHKNNFKFLYPDFVKSSNHALKSTNTTNAIARKFSVNKHIIQHNSHNSEHIQQNIHFDYKQSKPGNKILICSDNSGKYEDSSQMTNKNSLFFYQENAKKSVELCDDTKFEIQLKDKMLPKDKDQEASIMLLNHVRNDSNQYGIKKFDIEGICDEYNYNDNLNKNNFKNNQNININSVNENLTGEFHFNDLNNINNVNDYYFLNKRGDTVEKKLNEEIRKHEVMNHEIKYEPRKLTTYNQLLSNIKNDLFSQWNNSLRFQNFQSFSIISHPNIIVHKNNKNPMYNINDNTETSHINLVPDKFLIQKNFKYNEFPKSSLNCVRKIKEIVKLSDEERKEGKGSKPDLFYLSDQDEVVKTITARLEIKDKDLILNSKCTENKKANNFDQNEYKEDCISKKINHDSLVFLVIDDNLYIRNSVKNVLKSTLKILKKKKLIKKEYEIFDGGDGVDALKYLIDPNIGSRVKGIFIDENMEYLNGSETIKIIRKFQDLNKVHKFNIATVTAFEDADTRATILEAGVDEIYPKPLSKAHLEDFFNKFPIKE